MTRRNKTAQAAELLNGPGQTGSSTDDQSGDTQGLSRIAEMADESVQELADDGQAYEAEVVEGVEESGDHPEQPAHTHEDQTRPSSLEPWTDGT